MIKDKRKLIIRNTDGTIAINYNELIEKVDKSWSDIEKARFLYIELGKFFIYDSDFVSAEDTIMRERIGARGIAEIKNFFRINSKKTKILFVIRRKMVSISN